MKKVLYFVIVALMTMTTSSCDFVKKSLKLSPDTEEQDEEDMEDEDEDSDEDAEEAEAEEAEESEAEESEEAALDELNAALLGSWSNNADPGINMVLADKAGNYDGHKGYGYIVTYNEFFESEYTYVFNSIEADGENIKVMFTKTQMECVAGDPDNYDSEEPAEWVEKVVASGIFTVQPAGRNKCKLASGDKKLNHLTLYK